MSDKTDDDQGYFIPGIYMMSTKEAIEAGFISYDKPEAAGDEHLYKIAADAQKLDKRPLLDRLREAAKTSHYSLYAEAYCALKPIAQHNDPIAQPEESSRNSAEPVAPPAGVCAKSYNDEVCVKSYNEPSPSPAIGDVEKLIERLEDCAEGLDSENRRDTCCAQSMRDAAAMLRSLADTKANLIAQVNDMATMVNEARTERDKYAALYMDRCEKWSALRAKLEEPCDVCEAHVDQARQLRAKLERAREALEAIGHSYKWKPNTDLAILDQCVLLARATLREISPSREA